MSYVISHRFSSYYWCNHRLRMELPAQHRSGLPRFDPPVEDVFEKTRMFLEKAHLKGSVDFLVDDAGKRRTNEFANSHVVSAESLEGAFWMIDDNLVICGPELSFLQVANAQKNKGFEGFLRTVDFGYELCGIYKQQVSRNWDFVQTLFGGKPDMTPDETPRLVEPVWQTRPPVTTPERIASFLEQANNVPGIKMARACARYILANSASPMETQEAMVLTLPRKYGGCGFARPLLNCQIPLDASGQHALRMPYVVVDMFWPQSRLVIEYDGEDEHDGKAAPTHDSRRRAVLTAMGNTVLTVRKGQMNEADIGVLSKVVASALSDNRRGLSSKPDKQSELLAILKSMRTPIGIVDTRPVFPFMNGASSHFSDCA